MRLKTAIDNGFTLPTYNNFYNSTGWFLMMKEMAIPMLKRQYGLREIFDNFLPDGFNWGTSSAAEMAETVDDVLAANTWRYNHLYDLYIATYNPIWNYEGSETRTRERDMTDTKSGTDTVSNSGTDVQSYKGSQKDSNSGNVQQAKTTFDSDTDYDTVKTTDTTATERTFTNRTDELEHGLTTETEYDSGNTVHEEETETMTRGGNMGTTSTQSMMLQEIEVAGKLNLINTILLDIVQAICYC